MLLFIKEMPALLSVSKKALIAVAAAAGVEPTATLRGESMRLKISPAGEPAKYVALLKAGKYTPARLLRGVWQTQASWTL